MKYDKFVTGQRIARRRKSRKLKQTELAEKLGISNNHLSAIENGKENPSLEMLMKICETLEITPDYLLLGTMHSNNIPTNITEGLRLCSPEDLILLSGIVELMIERNEISWNNKNYI